MLASSSHGNQGEPSRWAGSRMGCAHCKLATGNSVTASGRLDWIPANPFERSNRRGPMIRWIVRSSIALDRLCSLQTGNGKFRHRFRTTRLDSGESLRTLEPAWPNDPMDREIFERYASRMEKVANEETTRDTVMQGLEAYMNAVWASSS